MDYYDYYQSKMSETLSMNRQIFESRKQLHQTLLVASGSLFGILISLHDKTETNLLCRLSFFLSLVLIGLGILTIAITLFQEIDGLQRLKSKYLDEVKQAADESREVSDVLVGDNKLFVWFGRIGYTCLLLSVISLCAYEFFVSFPELYC